MNVPKLLRILQTESIFFARITTLQRDDPYEGVMPAALRRFVIDKERAVASDLPTAADLEVHTGCACVSCWHVNEEESAALWKLYSAHSGVAIQSSVSILMSLFSGKGVKMALVKYTNFEGDEAPILPYPVYYKRKSFDHERELRCVILDSNADSAPDGVSVRVEVGALLQRLYVSPEAPTWIADVVRAEIAHYGLSSSVIRSDLLTLK
jgi:hypothetical protein